MLDVSRIDKNVLSKLYSAGWSETRTCGTLDECVRQLIADKGYDVFDYAYEIIKSFEGISISFSKTEIEQLEIVSYYGDIEFSARDFGIDTVMEAEVYQHKYSEPVVPIGAINGQVILLVGESKIIYADIGSKCEIVGNDIEDFLNKCVKVKRSND